MFDSGMFLRAAADAGDLRVNPDEARAAVEKLGKVKDSLTMLRNSMRSVGGETRLQLGANSVGVAMSDKTYTKTSGGESLHAAVDKLLEQATNAYYAVNRAMENYDYTDETGARKFRPQH